MEGDSTPNTKRRRARPSTLPTKGKEFTKVLSKMRYKINLKDNEAEVSSIQKTKGGGAHAELGIGLKTMNMSTLCGAVKQLLGEKTLVSNTLHTRSWLSGRKGGSRGGHQAFSSVQR